MKKLLSLLFAGLLAVSLSACAGGTDDTAGSRSTSGGSGVVVVPANFNASGLQVVTLGGFADVRADGSFYAKFPDDMVSFVMVKDKATGTAVYYGYIFPAGSGTTALAPYTLTEGARIDDASTALTLAMMNPLFFGATTEQKIGIAENIVTHPLFSSLVAKIGAAREAGFVTALDPTINRAIYVAAKDLAVRSVADNARADEPQTFEPEALVFDTDAAWIEQSSGLGMVFKNPKMIYYAAGSYVGDALVDQYPPLILPKEKIIDFSLWPPRFELAAPAETGYSMPDGGTYTVKIYKGIQLDMSAEQLWGTLPARIALLGNTWLTIQMIVSLCGDVGILPGGNVGVDILVNVIGITKADFVYKVYQAVDSGDVMTIINVFVDFFKANAGSIASMVSGAFSSGSSDPAAASSLISQAGDLVGIATSLFDVVNTEVPFFYDLISAHESVSYEVVNGVVQDNAPDSAGGGSSGNGSGSKSSCSTSPFETNASMALLLVLLPIAYLAVRRRVTA